MLRPTPGELLEGVRRELKDQVLPALPTGSASRQLKAALHVLDKIARTWDLQHHYVEADNADLELTLTELARLAGSSRHQIEPSGAEMPGVTDSALRDLLARNESLQSELETLQRNRQAGGQRSNDIDELTFALHTRMAARAAVAGGI